MKNKNKKEERYNLNTLSDDLILKYANEQKGWDFYQEREFIENLFNQRFNYFLAIYTLIVTGFVTVTSRSMLIIILWIGFFITLFLALNLYRAYVKLDILFKILHKLPPPHVFRIIDKEVKSMKWKALFPVNCLTGWFIPLFCILSLCGGLWYAYNIYVDPNENNSTHNFLIINNKDTQLNKTDSIFNKNTIIDSNKLQRK